MKKTMPIFAASIVATIIITILSTMLVAPEIFTTEKIPSVPILTEFGTTPEGTFYWPRGVAANSTGHIFVADTQNSRMQIFNPDNTFNSVFSFPGNSPTDGSVNQPFGVIINSTDFVYVADTFTNVIKVYDPNGAYLKTIGTAGTTNGTFYYPSGITFNATNVYYIADTFNNRLQVYNATTDEFIQTIPP